MDYFTPQLYWPIKPEAQSYPRLLAWWASENTKHRHLWPGNAAHRVGAGGRGIPASEIVEQIRVTRAQPGATGNVFFSMRSLQNNRGNIAEALKSVYTEPALVPASPWLAKETPAKPQLAWQDKSLRISPAAEAVHLYVVRTRAEGKWTVRIHPVEKAANVVLPFPTVPERIVVTAIDRVGQESEAALAEVK